MRKLPLPLPCRCLQSLARKRSEAQNVSLFRRRPNFRQSSATGTGSYGAVGFAYDVTPGGEDPSGSGTSDSEDDWEEEEQPRLADEDVDNLAANMGIDGFSAMLRRVEKQESEFAAGNVKRAK